MPKNVQRCGWGTADPLYIAYHDREWGRPVHDDKRLFEFLVLEGAQAGLSWSTILHKRENYRKAFAGFDPAKVARFGSAKIAALMRDSGIVRNRLKIRSAINNAKAFLRVASEFGSFNRYVWQFVGGKPIVHHYRALRDIPTFTKEAASLSKDLRKRGFSFVGPGIVYSFMQACGLVNDHITGCFLSRRRHTKSR